jgi:hypothetical protein
MPLTGTGKAILGPLLKAAVDSEVAAATAAGRPVNRDAVFGNMGQAIEAWIVANGTLAVVGTATGVTAGPAAVPVVGNIV